MKLKELITKHKTAVLVVGGVAVVLIVWLAWAYLGASSEVTVPKAERYEANANAAQQQSTVAETQANSYREQRIEAHSTTTRSKGTLKERKADYEKARTNRGVSNANLDLRERVLQSDLERLYPNANR
jgi:hypothetical protein